MAHEQAAQRPTARSASLRRLRPGSLLILAWAAALVALAGAQLQPGHARLQLAGSSGSLTQQNSDCNNTTLVCSAILVTPPMKPGGASSSATVTIKNTGSTSNFTLYQTNLVNTYGVPLPSGYAAQSAKLTLLVQDITISSMPQTVYSGTVAGFPSTGKALGQFRNGDQHTYRFTVTPWARSTPAADNPYQGARTTVTYQWKQS